MGHFCAYFGYFLWFLHTIETFVRSTKYEHHTNQNSGHRHRCDFYWRHHLGLFRFIHRQYGPRRILIWQNRYQ